MSGITLTPKQKKEIIKREHKGETRRHLAWDYKVSPSTVCKIMRAADGPMSQEEMTRRMRKGKHPWIGKMVKGGRNNAVLR